MGADFFKALKSCFENINFKSECMSDCFCCIKDSEIEVDIDIEKNEHHKHQHHKHHKHHTKDENINNT